MYRKGDIVFGIVTDIKNRGIIISVNGSNITGFVHISELSNSFVKHISDYVHIGDQVKAVVLEDNTFNSNRLKLSIKRLDYYNLKKNKKTINETTTGFINLQKYLTTWVDAKIEELQKRNILRK